MRIGFTGEVHPARCQCHQGLFVVLVFCIRENHPRQCVDQVFFKTELEAAAKMEATVTECAKGILAELGLTMDEAREKTVAHGEAAVKAENQLRNQSNPSLH